MDAEPTQGIQDEEDTELHATMIALECMNISSQVPQPSLQALVLMAMAGVPVNAEAMNSAFILECSEGEEKTVWGALSESEPSQLDSEWQQAIDHDLFQIIRTGDGRVVLFDPFWDFM